MKCVDTELIVYTSPDKKLGSVCRHFLEVVLYICSYREIEQELILKQRNAVFGYGFIRNSDVSEDSDEFLTIPFNSFFIMGKITFKDYKKALLAHYDAIKSEDVTGILLHPTPAQIRQLCNMKIDAGLNRVDEEVMRAFFEIKKEDSLKIAIERCNIDKFRPIISFLKREKDTESSLRIELIAVLIDFSPRPYAKFSDLKNEPSKGEDSSTAEENTTADLPQTNKKQKTNSFKKILYVLLGLIGLSSLGYFVKDKLMPEKQCMQWQSDHYELLDCNSKISSLYNEASILPIDDSVLLLKKVIITDTTTFFKGGKAIVWYCKVDGFPECFNGPGLHPITGNALRPISEYIIVKYFRK